MHEEKAGGVHHEESYALPLFGLSLCSSLSLFAVSISTVYDHSANLSQYKTYFWLKVQAGDSQWADRLQQDTLRQKTRNSRASNGRGENGQARATPMGWGCSGSHPPSDGPKVVKG
jgi:hypothetical protein